MLGPWLALSLLAAVEALNIAWTSSLGQIRRIQILHVDDLTAAHLPTSAAVIAIAAPVQPAREADGQRNINALALAWEDEQGSPTITLIDGLGRRWSPLDGGYETDHSTLRLFLESGAEDHLMAAESWRPLPTFPVLAVMLQAQYNGRLPVRAAYGNIRPPLEPMEYIVLDELNTLLAPLGVEGSLIDAAALVAATTLSAGQPSSAAVAPYFDTSLLSSLSPIQTRMDEVSLWSDFSASRTPVGHRVPFHRLRVRWQPERWLDRSFLLLVVELHMPAPSTHTEVPFEGDMLRMVSTQSLGATARASIIFRVLQTVTRPLQVELVLQSVRHVASRSPEMALVESLHTWLGSQSFSKWLPAGSVVAFDTVDGPSWWDRMQSINSRIQGDAAEIVAQERMIATSPLIRMMQHFLMNGPLPLGSPRATQTDRAEPVQRGRAIINILRRASDCYSLLGATKWLAAFAALDDSQQDAVRAMLAGSPIVVVNGGPGSGKTHVARVAIAGRILLSSLRGRVQDTILVTATNALAEALGNALECDLNAFGLQDRYNLLRGMAERRFAWRRTLAERDERRFLRSRALQEEAQGTQDEFRNPIVAVGTIGLLARPGGFLTQLTQDQAYAGHGSHLLIVDEAQALSMQHLTAIIHDAPALQALALVQDPLQLGLGTVEREWAREPQWAFVPSHIDLLYIRRSPPTIVADYLSAEYADRGWRVLPSPVRQHLPAALVLEIPRGQATRRGTSQLNTHLAMVAIRIAAMFAEDEELWVMADHSAMATATADALQTIIGELRMPRDSQHHLDHGMEAIQPSRWTLSNTNTVIGQERSVVVWVAPADSPTEFQQADDRFLTATTRARDVIVYIVRPGFFDSMPGHKGAWARQLPHVRVSSPSEWRLAVVLALYGFSLQRWLQREATTPALQERTLAYFRTLGRTFISDHQWRQGRPESSPLNQLPSRAGSLPPLPDLPYDNEMRVTPSRLGQGALARLARSGDLGREVAIAQGWQEGADRQSTARSELSRTGGGDAAAAATMLVAAASLAAAAASAAASAGSDCSDPSSDKGKGKRRESVGSFLQGSDDGQPSAQANSAANRPSTPVRRAPGPSGSRVRIEDIVDDRRQPTQTTPIAPHFTVERRRQLERLLNEAYEARLHLETLPQGDQRHLLQAADLDDTALVEAVRAEIEHLSERERRLLLELESLAYEESQIRLKMWSLSSSV